MHGDNQSVFSVQTIDGNNLSANLNVHTSNNDTSDIVLAPSGKIKSNGRVWILVIVLFAILVGIGVWFATNNNDNGNSSDALTAEAAFNRYANYFSNGSTNLDEFSDDYTGFESSVMTY